MLAFSTFVPFDNQTTPRRNKANLLLQLVRQWLEEIKINNPKVAHLLCRLIPARCPFERDIQLWGYKLFHVPPLCKLNPFYEQLSELRFRALSFLANDCHEDISQYYC